MNEPLKAGKLSACQVLAGVSNVTYEQAVLHAKSEQAQFAAWPAALEAGGDASTIRMRNVGSIEKCAFTKLGKVVMWLTKTRGARDAS
jgi:hypothetical protein